MDILKAVLANKVFLNFCSCNSSVVLVSHPNAIFPPCSSLPHMYANPVQFCGFCCPAQGSSARAVCDLPLIYHRNVPMGAPYPGGQPEMSQSSSVMTGSLYRELELHNKLEKVNTTVKLFLLSVFHWGDFPSLSALESQKEIRGNSYLREVVLSVGISNKARFNTCGSASHVLHGHGSQFI